LFITTSELLDWLKKYHLMNEELKRTLRARNSVLDCDIESAIIKVKQSRYRPGVAQRIPGSLGPQIS
jgi:hypothetical protein